MCTKRIYWCLIHLMLLICASTEEVISNHEPLNGSEVILSRRKRYLIFPEGSSLQLVYDYVIPIIGRPSIWTFGITASLAWLLPSEPEHIRNIKNLKKTADQRIDKVQAKNKLIYTDQKYPTTYKNDVRYTGHKQTYIPTYPDTLTGPQNYDNGSYYSVPFYRHSDRRIYSYKGNRYQKPSEKYNGFYDHSNYFNHPLYTKLHRITRRNLYPKIEEFFRTLRKDGRACLLKTICEVSKSADGEGSFIEEIIKTIFRNKASQEEQEEFDDYDQAAHENNDCDKLYPSCTFN